MQLSDDEWKKKLTPEQYDVLRKSGTEAPFTGKLLHNKESGTYKCVACGAELFHSDTKFESKIPGLEGWPSFSEVINSDSVDLQEDTSLGMNRTEIICKNCGGHIGHLFDDSESDTGKHYCVNSCALDFEPQEQQK